MRATIFGMNPSLAGPAKSSVATLREITKDSVRDFCRMEVGPGQDGLVAPNATSIAQAMHLLIDYATSRPGAKNMLLSFVSKDGNPENFYKRFGFSRTGGEDCGELIMKLPLGPGF